MTQTPRPMTADTGSCSITATADRPVPTGHRTVLVNESDLPFDALARPDASALAVITGVDGAFYRPVGAAMAVGESGWFKGSLSSGCIERDIALHAQRSMQDGAARHLRYGRGSPFVDLQLPCGAGLDVDVLPFPDPRLIAAARSELAARREAVLHLTAEGRLSPCPTPPGLTLRIRPRLRFLVFGQGPAARLFTQLAESAGYATELHSPDPETLEGMATGRMLQGFGWPEAVKVDPRTAVTLFFHDHDREPPLLAAALRSSAFYIGALGSQRAHLTRLAALERAGLSAKEIGRLASPFGLIPSVRDASALSVSVLAQALQAAE